MKFNPKKIIGKISDKESVEWDIDATIHILNEFIGTSCKEKEFVKFVRRLAKADKNLTS